MPDLTKFDKSNTTLGLIETDSPLENRTYLGMSEIGHECSRYLWYSFHWAYADTVPNRLRRLWARGHREEPVLFELLQSIGYICEDPQTEFVDILGHFKGHWDGTVSNVIEAPKTKHLFEAKTLSDKNFKKLCKERLEKYSSAYWAQVHLYMHYGKLTRCFFIAVNKNDDSLYIERVRFDSAIASFYIEKAKSIILDSHPPARAFPGPTYYKCKWCSAKDQCWSQAPLAKNCRTCKSSSIALDGQWNCAQAPRDELEKDWDIPVKVQRTGCDAYEALEDV